MAKKSKLLSALDAHKNVDYGLQKQKKLQKQAAKRKRAKEPTGFFYHGDPVMSGGLQSAADGDQASEQESSNQSSEQEGGSQKVNGAIDTSHIEDSKSNSEDTADEAQIEPPESNGVDSEQPEPQEEERMDTEDDIDEDAEEGIPLSDIEDLSEEEKGDIIPHQRLTINNTTALTKAYNSIALPLANLPFSEHQTIISKAPISIPDVNDDLNRELAFHKQCLLAAKEGRYQLKKEGIAFSRPPDFFAEMVKSDEHMGKVKQRMTDEAANRKAAAEARKQRDLRKFGKQVQVAKLQDRDQAKRQTLEKINILKRKRKNTDTGGAEETDLFDVALEDASKPDKSGRPPRIGQGGRGPSKRQKKDDKFGFGGKKRFAKSGDAVSTSDFRGVNSRTTKGQKKGSQRLGKSRRAQK
ncbi:MAG: hypothetical protein LQ349_004092 [Xanthoria aureola]|nr:MAG: hypothetical protein LQ349_004092 [Xanthoria aureola]